MGKDVFQRCYDFHDAELVRQSGLYPYFQALEGSDGPTVRCNGREVVMLGSNNYLGLTHHPDVLRAAHEAIDRYGTGCTGSRFLNGNLALHDTLEKELAAFFHKEAALVFSAGFLANAGTLTLLADDPDVVIFSDADNHASIIEGLQRVRGEVRIFRSPDDLRAKLAGQADWSHALVVTEGIFSMTGRVSDLRPFADLQKQYGFRLYLDDAHGIGVLGPQGRGTAAEQGLLDDVDLLFGTFSKSFASVGGFVVGEARVIDYLRHRARTFMFTAGLPPASAAAALAALRVMQEDDEMFERLAANAAFLKQGLERLGWFTMGSRTPIIPAFVGSESLSFRICKDLLELGVFTTPVMYPAVPYGQALIRTSVTPALTRAQLQQAIDAFAVVRHRYPIPPVDPENLPRTEGMDYTYFLTQG